MSSDDLMETEAGFDYHKIPIDAFYLDLHHTDEMKYFTWNPKTFPNPEKLLDHFHKKNRWLVTI
jgi:alpha-glucosidase (family GH31 glycosyl hydrolase)